MSGNIKATQPSMHIKASRNLRHSDNLRSTKRASDKEPDQRKRQKKSQKEYFDIGKKHDSILEEIRALGGDEQDLELIGNSDTSSENEQLITRTSSQDKSFENELVTVASKLGFLVAPKMGPFNSKPSRLANDKEAREKQDGRKSIPLAMPKHLPESVPEPALEFAPETTRTSFPGGLVSVNTP